jgi:hypothetical protein
LQHLAHRIAANSSLDCILNIRNINTKACSRLAVHREIEIRLAKYTEESNIPNYKQNADSESLVSRLESS